MIIRERHIVFSSFAYINDSVITSIFSISVMMAPHKLPRDFKSHTGEAAAGDDYGEASLYKLTI